MNKKIVRGEVMTDDFFMSDPAKIYKISERQEFIKQAAIVAMGALIEKRPVSMEEESYAQAIASESVIIAQALAKEVLGE